MHTSSSIRLWVAFLPTLSADDRERVRRALAGAPASAETVATQDDGSGGLTVRRSKTDQDGAGAVLYIGRQAMAGRWSSSVMPASYIRGQSAGRNAVAQYYADQQE